MVKIPRKKSPASGLISSPRTLWNVSKSERRSEAAKSAAFLEKKVNAKCEFKDSEIERLLDRENLPVEADGEDGDGYLGVADVQSFFEALGETLTVAETAELVRLVDRDDDGLVDFDEFFDLATRSAQFVDADATRE